MAFSALLFFSTFLLFLGGLAGVFVCVCVRPCMYTLSLSRGVHTEYVSMGGEGGGGGDINGTHSWRDFQGGGGEGNRVEYYPPPPKKPELS